MLLKNCARPWHHLRAFEIISRVFSAVAIKTHDLVTMWGFSPVSKLLTSAPAFVQRATSSLTPSAAARPASAAHILITRVIAAVKSSQIVFFLVLLLEGGVEHLLHDRVDLFRLEH